MNLQKFDISQIKNNKNIAIIGKCGTGKSFLVKDILYHCRDIPYGTAISHTEEMYPYYSKMMDK